MRSPELDAFTAECRATEEDLAAMPLEALPRPALGAWSLHELCAHLIGAAERLATYAEQDPGGDAAVHDRVSYWRFDLEAEAPKVAARARERAAELPPEALPQAFADAWRGSAARFAQLGPRALIATLRGPMLAGEYLATRVLEVCVHRMDVRAALDLPPAATPQAARLTMDILEALLGEPRPRNLGRTRFILTATGRTPSDDPRFPVIR